jgi:redox-sensitive bicupin YhaK (pirin superfamily)
VHFLQIWIVPDTRNLEPAYGQLAFDRKQAERGFVLLASREGRDGSIRVHQDVDLWVALVGPGERREIPLRQGRQAWVHVARGAVSLYGTRLAEGAGAAVASEPGLAFVGEQPAEVLVFDMAWAGR